jgi:sorbitol/mannitol transport system substrate-binding protein
MNPHPKHLAALALACGLAGAVAPALAADLVIATVNNGHMIEMQKLSSHFEKTHPDIKLKWVTLEEGVLRQRVTTDIATKGGQFDVMTIGMYETPIWGKKSWLVELKDRKSTRLNSSHNPASRMPSSA